MKTGFPVYLLLLAITGLSACSLTPLGDEDLADHGDEPAGPGLISGETGEIVLFREPSNSSAEGPSDGQKQMTKSDWREFEAFKRWLDAKQSDNEEYREFQQWLQFESYRQWQKSTAQ